MTSKVQRWGNSLAVRIPKAFAAETGLEAESEVDLSLQDGSLVVTPRRRRPYELEALLAEVEPENLHDETDFGPPVGAEVW